MKHLVVPLRPNNSLCQTQQTKYNFNKESTK